MTILAIDQGTTSTKAFLLHPDGRFESVGARRHAQFHPAEGQVEHDAAEILATIEALIDEGLAGAAEIAGIALANQGETVVAWDRATGRPIGPAIVWQDQRTQGWLDRMAPDDRARVTALSGLPLDAYFSASKLAWLLEARPDARACLAAGKLGLATSDAYFLDRLTGRYATDPTTASRTSLMNLDTCAWDADLCRIFGVPPETLPEILPTTGAFGTVARGGRKIPLVASVVDQQAALWGHGCPRVGDLKITFGTGSFALALTGPAPRRDAEGLVPTVAWKLGSAPPVYAVDGGDYTAAAAVDWAISVGLARDLADFDLPEAPSALERGIVFLPALAGLAAPHWDRAVAAGFLGLRQNTTAADMRRAVLEGVALRAVELVEALAPGGAGGVSVDGGLTRNATFLRFLADALGRPVLVRDHPDLTGLGAAELGFAALGLPVPPRASDAGTEIRPSPASPAIRTARGRFSAALAALRDWAAH